MKQLKGQKAKPESFTLLTRKTWVQWSVKNDCGILLIYVQGMQEIAMSFIKIIFLLTGSYLVSYCRLR